MRLEKSIEKNGVKIDRVLYDDIYGVSELFEPKIWIDFWSRDRSFFLKTMSGDKVEVTENELRQLNLKVTSNDLAYGGKTLYKCFMSVNSPRRASERIPLLSISKKLNKIWKGSINVEREYERRWESGYRGWCAERV